MTEQVKLDLGNVQKTLFLPLWGRAVETRKARPMLIDDMAARIIDMMDVDFAGLVHNIDDLTQIAWIKRAQIGDRVIQEFLEHYPDGTIVNIGCGLDTTFDRIDNGRLRWYDLDLPDVIDLRRKFIQENERRTFIPSSFLEEQWINKITVNGNVLFLVAGVFYYFEEQEVKGFLLRLTDAFRGCQVLFDVSSPMGVKIANKKVIEASGLDSRSYLKWGLEDVNEILAWDPRIKLLGTYFYFRTLQIGLRNFIMGTLSDLMKIQYMVHLKLGSER